MVGKKRLSMGLVLTIFLCLAAVGTTLAYLYAETNILSNAFSLGNLTVEIIENEKDPGEEDTLTPSGDTAVKEVKIRNDGNVNAYIRAAIVPTFRIGEGAQVESRHGNVDYSGLAGGGREIVCTRTEGDETTAHFILTLRQGWTDDWIFVPGVNAFYYKHQVPPDELTTILLAEVTRVAGEWETLNVEVLADALQAESEAETHPIENWPDVKIDANGRLVLNQ